MKESISRGQRGETISGEVAVFRLEQKQILTQTQAETIQQIISLRHAATHHLLPAVPVEVMQHLLFYSCKFLREVIEKLFPAHLKSLSENYVSLSFTDLTTYADKVQRSVSRVRKSANEKRLVWLLERGIQFDGDAYITEGQFARQYRGKKKILPHLKLSDFLKTVDMIRIVPVLRRRAISLPTFHWRKGSAADASLPVLVKKTDVELDYPLLTKELGAKVGRNQNWAARAVTVLNLKGDPRYHQPIRAGQSLDFIHTQRRQRRPCEIDW